MADFLDFLQQKAEELVPHEAEIVRAETREEVVNRQLREMENEILEQNLRQIEAAGAWPEVAKELDPKDDADIPPKWIERYGLDKARERYRIARAGMMSQKDAPVGLKHSVTLATGIIKARAHEKGGPKILNINLVKMPDISVKYPEQEVK